MVAYLVNPAKHNQLLDICYFRTPEEIDALWNDIEQKAKTIIDSDPDKYRNLTYEQLRDTDDPLLANVYKSLRKKLLVYANEKGHADHNVAKIILVFSGLPCCAI